MVDTAAHEHDGRGLDMSEPLAPVSPNSSGSVSVMRAANAQVRPAVAVLMTAYNADATIQEAVSSILNGTEPCDLYVVDDCSRNPASRLLDNSDKRINVIRLDTNVGPGRARNHGLERILQNNYPYVAIMDADDIAYPERLAKQREFLDSHPNVGAVGTWARFIDEQTRATVFYHCTPVAERDARDVLYFNSPIVHPSSLMRADALRAVGGYDQRFRTAEDYELFQRIAAHYDIANIPECLLDYRMSPHGQSLGNRHRQLTDRLKIQWLYFNPLRWRAWAGMGWTLMLYALPNKWLISLKSTLKRGPVL
jgi:glycosyltransferase involved in cell wall biosynthesis